MYNKIIQLAKDKGEKLTKYAGRIKDIGVAKKFLTKLDLEIERQFAQLIKSFPDHHVIFAEEENYSYEFADNVWIIDPISNTFNFIRGISHYAIAVSHLIKGRVVFALILDPSVKELFIAFKGKGATLNDKKIKVSNRSSEILLLYEFSSSLFNLDKGLNLMKDLSGLGKVKKSFGSMAVHYSYVACGRAEGAVTVNRDIFPEFAGKLLVEEAGGKVSDFEGKEITINSRGVIFTNGLIHQKTLDIVNRYV
ncbi:hypothetical protein A3B42_01705 [Candidatus Daviesbacteria bacterium RIFCSPLOWO2_01_FULL_38_10]|uniref:Inositol monophosphatase n=1 Tax=Candidatus Daviesbacteria bacterium GW2011_GWF2_38_6 TaxID=1618432 RepID=A0A0G0KP95_9BACT|nr:MAG: Inositol monophosphatase [Candidatus Daviesbacteria bacterium GW2011_GWF2_38_6]OGE29117.1 MAG: hypothetical protein A2772_01095 [Candidatus Daviesbacteria bacterium RIFCSPHIGHO2_01_FULL_38_8b]OGE40387.1 MAG: hypothetical protein A3B42_01705 [Candidatus Daviesbacteria bacterium RIFCSPLOWO2_01_FULL_38_10]OGE44534.1 MAG: hypothetical protein A3E67_02170 [Candidatus Daviesbacteria bacterium RIFCSPHIGHO2_12_FULL_38_25]OGE68305.1 MAG: hypothetical protein A3H81_01375 [Candidatus Daviesbacteri